MWQVIGFALIFSTLSAAAPAQTLQKQYEAGEAAFRQAKYEDSAEIFSDVYDRLSPRQRDSLVGGQVRLRLADSLVRMSLFRPAVAQLEQAVLTLERAGDAAADDAAEAHYLLGLAYEALGEMALAVEQEKLAIARPNLPFRNSARLALARAAIFADRPLARRMFDELIQEFVPDPADKFSGDKLGELMAMRSRVELNDGKFAAAGNLAEKALARTGGKNRLSLNDVRVRSDVSFASFLRGSEKYGAEMLASTGIGRVTPSPEFPSEKNIVLPDCTPSGNVEPDDMVIMEITIRDDGVVSYARPIYSTRPGKIEAAFVDAVYHWLWPEEKLKTVAPFWRSALRVELRCRNNADRRWIGAPFLDELFLALNSGEAAEEGQQTYQRLAEKHQELESLKAAGKGESARSLALLISLLSRDEWSDDKPDRYAQRAMLIASKLQLSERHRAIVRVFVMSILSARGVDEFTNRKARTPNIYLPEPDWPQDVRAWSEAELGLRAERRDADDEAQRHYEQVLSSSLPKSNPIVQFASLRLASILYVQNNVGKASSLVADTGLKPDQCSLVDATPVVDKWHVNSAVYPETAIRYGFNGWTMVASDIGVDGVPVKPRAVFSYPPFVFSKAVERSLAKARFKPMYREGAQIGCTDFQERFYFQTDAPEGVEPAKAWPSRIK